MLSFVSSVVRSMRLALSWFAKMDAKMASMFMKAFVSSELWMIAAIVTEVSVPLIVTACKVLAQR